MGLGELGLLLLFSVLVAMSVVAEQRLAPSLLAGGVLLLTCLYVSFMLGLRCPYYTLFFLAVELVTAGAIGLIVLALCCFAGRARAVERDRSEDE